MLLLLSKNTFADGCANFCLELVFRKTSENLYDYQSGVLQALYENGELNGLPKWTPQEHLSLVARIFQSAIKFRGGSEDWFSTAHCVDNGFKEYNSYIDINGLNHNPARETKTYNKNTYDLKMKFSGADYLLNGQLNLFFDVNRPIKLDEIVRDIFLQKQLPNKPIIVDRKFWLLDLEQFKNINSITALNSEDFEFLLYPQKRGNVKRMDNKYSVSHNLNKNLGDTRELEYKKRALEFRQRKRYRHPIKRSDIVNLSKFNYEISNLNREKFGDCSGIDFNGWKDDFEPEAYKLDSNYYGFIDYDSLTRCDLNGKSYDFISSRGYKWVSENNILYYAGKNNTFESLCENLVFDLYKTKSHRARKLVNKRLGKECSDISKNRRSGGWKETSKKRKQWMK